MFLLKNINYKYLVLFIFSLSSYHQCFAQDERQLLLIIASTKNDSIKADALSSLGYILREEKNEQAILYGLKAKEISEKLNNNYLKESAYRTLGVCYDFSDDFTNSILFYRKAIASSKAINDVAFLANIYHERFMELATEGHRWFDLVRTGRAASVLAWKGFKPGVNEILPIPQVELNNTKLKQNPGYN